MRPRFTVFRFSYPRIWSQSIKDHATASSTWHILRAMRRTKHYDTFYASLYLVVSSLCSCTLMHPVLSDDSFTPNKKTRRSCCRATREHNSPSKLVASITYVMALSVSALAHSSSARADECVDLKPGTHASREAPLADLARSDA